MLGRESAEVDRRGDIVADPDAESIKQDGRCVGLRWRGEGRFRDAFGGFSLEVEVEKARYKKSSENFTEDAPQSLEGV